MLAYLAVAIGAVAWVSCGTFKVYDRAGQVVTEATFGGKGCAVIETTQAGDAVVILEQDGMSNVLGGTISTLVGVAGEVFGAGQREPDMRQAGEGCAGVLYTPGADSAP